MGKLTQNGMIITHMQLYGTITSKEAMDIYGCMRLASRIADIKKMGYTVIREMVTVQNRWGEDVRVARYSLKEDANEH